MGTKKPRGIDPHGRCCLKGLDAAAHPGRLRLPHDFPDAVRGQTVFLRQLDDPRAFRIFAAYGAVSLVQFGPHAAPRSPSGPSVGPGDVDGAALEIPSDLVHQILGKNLFRVDVTDSEPPFLRKGDGPPYGEKPLRRVPPRKNDK